MANGDGAGRCHQGSEAAGGINHDELQRSPAVQSQCQGAVPPGSTGFALSGAGLEGKEGRLELEHLW